MHSFKFAADFDTPLEHLLSLSREFDLTSTWNSYVLDSMILQEPSIFESTVYSGSWLPFPFPSIDCVVQARGVDLADVSCLPPLPCPVPSPYNVVLCKLRHGTGCCELAFLSVGSNVAQSS